MRLSSHLWTKDEIRTILKLWETKTFSEIRDLLGVKENQLSYVVTQLRRAGIKLPKKRINGVTNNLIMETMQELGITPTRPL